MRVGKLHTLRERITRRRSPLMRRTTERRIRPQKRPEPNVPSVSLNGPPNGDGGVSETAITSPSASPYPVARVVASRWAAVIAFGSAR